MMRPGVITLFIAVAALALPGRLGWAATTEAPNTEAHGGHAAAGHAADGGHGGLAAWCLLGDPHLALAAEQQIEALLAIEDGNAAVARIARRAAREHHDGAQGIDDAFQVLLAKGNDRHGGDEVGCQRVAASRWA